jgi:hypothetical protein
MAQKHEIISVLHAHPHFYSPQNNREVRHDERAYTRFRPIPNLIDIVESGFEKNIGIYALSDCHTPTGGTDNRFELYMQQLHTLESSFDVDPHLENGWLYISRKNPKEGQLPHIVLLHTQETRATHNDSPADINVIGSKKLMKHSLKIDTTAKQAKDRGGFALICHPNSNCGAGIEKAFDMTQREKAYLEGFNATASQSENIELMYKQFSQGLRGVSVPDSHHFTQADSAYILVDSKLHKDFSIEELENRIIEGDFTNVAGYIPITGNIIYHKLPILASIPGHLARKPKQIIKVLTKRK